MNSYLAAVANGILFGCDSKSGNGLYPNNLIMVGGVSASISQSPCSDYITGSVTTRQIGCIISIIRLQPDTAIIIFVGYIPGNRRVNIIRAISISTDCVI
jgi:hypothetical protein